MSGIDCQITLNVNKLPAGTPQMQRLLKRGLAAHVFNDETTMNQVAQAIGGSRQLTGII